MKVALAVWDGRMAPVFDVSREALVLTIEQGAITSRSVESIQTEVAWQKTDGLVALGITTLVCGAITEPLQQDLEARGIQVIGFVAGEIDEIVQGLLQQRLPSRALSMPGCGRRRNRFRGGHGQGADRRGQTGPPR